MRRASIWLVAITAAATLAVLLGIHTPWARNRALAWAADVVTRFDLTLRATDLSYNAITRRITLTDVQLAAKAHEDRPFLVANRIDVKLSWTALRGHFALDHLAIEGGVVDIYRDADGVVNLPPGSTTPSPLTPRHLDIRSLALRGLDVRYVDVARNWGITAPRIEAALVTSALGAQGAFAVRGPLAVRLDERTMTIAPFETVMTFDGSDVSLADTRLVSSELNAVLAGQIHRVLDSPNLELTLKGTVDLAHASRWVPPPVPVSGGVAIDGTVTGPGSDFVTALRVTSSTLSVGRERNLALAGPVLATFDAFAGTQLVITPESGGELRADFNVPWGASSISKAAASWRALDAQTALDMANVSPQAIAAGFDGNGTFEFGEPRRYVITNRSLGRSKPKHVAMTGTVRAVIVGDNYQFDHDHRFPAFTFDGRMSGRLNYESALLSTMTGPAHARVSDVAEASRGLAVLGFPVPEIAADVHGAIDAPMTLAGSYLFPQVETRVSGEAVDVPLLGRVRASAHVIADTRRADITEVDVQQGTTTIAGQAVANITDEQWAGSFTVTAPHAEELQAGVPEAWRVSGPVQAAAALGGTFDIYTLDTTITGTSLTWAGQPVERATATAMVTPDAIDVTALELRQGAGFLDGRIHYAWETGAYTASLKGDRLSWQGTVLAPNDTQAQFALQFEGAGTTAQPRGTARVDFALSGGEAGTLIGAGDLTAELMGDQARVVARLPSVGALVNADIATAAPYNYQATAVLDRLELARLSPFIDAVGSEVRGFANGTVTASGRLADARDRVAIVNLTELDAGIGGVPVTLSAPANLALRGDAVTLKDLDLRIGSGRLTAAGEWNPRRDGLFQGRYAGDFQDALRMGRALGVPVTVDGTGALAVDLRSNGTRAGTLATLSLKAGTFNWGGGPQAVTTLNVDGVLQGESLTVSRLSGEVASGGVVGRFAATARAQVPVLELAAIDGELTVEAAKFTFSGIPVEQQRPSRVQLSRGSLAVADISWLVASNPLVIGGSIGFAQEDPPLDLSVQGLIDLRVLSAFVSTVAFDGDANLNTLITGTVSRPLFDGEIMLKDAEVAVADPRLVLSDMNGPIVLDGRLLVLDSLRGLANGGTFALDGSLQVAGVDAIEGTVSIQAQGVAIELLNGLRSEIDALVTFRPDPKGPSITGDIRVVQSSYDETITIASLARRARTPVSPTQQRPYLDRIRLDLAVTTSDDMVVDNNYGRLAAGANVRLTGTAAAPGMAGRITLREGGEVFLAGRTFRITRGDISFTDLRRINPEFNIVAEAPLSGSRGNARMTLAGTLERPTIDLTSDDGSKTPEQLASELLGEAYGSTALTLLSADLLGVTGRAIGLDSFRVERGDFADPDFRDDPSAIGASGSDPTTRLTLSKRLSRQVEFTVSQNLRESGNTTFIISYFLTPAIEVRAVSRDDDTVSIGIRHQVTFGGGVSTSPAELRVKPKVSALTFAGVDPAIEQEVRGQLKLGPGDDFDFLVLQRDGDRVRDRFKGQGYLQARVRTRRVELPDGTLTLEYAVDRGPRTVLEVVGITLPASLTAELEEAWHRNVLDQFLIDDLTHRVRRYLVSTNELGSVVVGTVDRTTPGTKQLRIDVTQGVPVSGREIRITGNQALASRVLLAEITAQGLAVDAWLDRTAAERALVAAYNEAGFLKAEVAGGPLTIDGDAGVLPITIVEGPRAQITTVTFDGVPEGRLALIRKVAAVPSPAPYVAGDVDSARTRVEQQYRLDGYNAADVEVLSDVAADDTVHLTFAITEGPRQVLQEVEVTGLELTRRSVLNGALGFEPGKPVNLDEWTLARKRLYDTNVFQLVDIQPVPVGDTVDGVQPVKARVAVQEYPAWAFRYGFQLEGDRQLELNEFTSTQNAGVVAELKNPNLFGRALTFNAFGMYQFDRQDATLMLATSRLFGWRARSSVYGFYSRDLFRDDAGQEILAINDVQGFSADQRWRARGMQIVYGYRFERSRTFDPEPGNDPFPLDFVSNLATLSTAALWDRRNDPLAPVKGTFSSASLDHAASWLGSDVRNRKLLLQQYAFVPLGRVVLASRAQWGKKFGPDPLFLDERFQAGGATTVRGYGEDSLGPRDAAGLPLGGEALLVLNQEVRFPVYRWVNAVTFIDAGNILGINDTFSWSDVKIGYGAGLRFATPVGMLRVDFGIPGSTVPSLTTREANSLRGGRWYFGIGHIF